MSFLLWCVASSFGSSPASDPRGGAFLFSFQTRRRATPSYRSCFPIRITGQTAQDEVVAGGRIPLRTAQRIPDRPGLGVDLDYDQLARGRERYQKIPYRRRDDEAEMRQQVDPNWKRVLPRW